jgi:hypothetical protein
VTCHRRYTFVIQVSDISRIDDELRYSCERYWWFMDPEVRHESKDQHQVSFGVLARDQWWAHRRAMSLMEQVLWPRQVPVPTWEPLPPHTNRGRYRK